MIKFEKVGYDFFRKDVIRHLQFDGDDPVFEENCRKAYDSIVIPERKTQGSAGYDFMTPFNVRLVPGESVIFPTGIKAMMNDFNVLLVFVRSSIGLKRHCMIPNSVGVIDSDYYGNPDNDGDIMMALQNIGKAPIEIAAGERVAQGVFLMYDTVWREWKDTPPAGQRKGGIGSTD